MSNENVITLCSSAASKQAVFVDHFTTLAEMMRSQLAPNECRSVAAYVATMLETSSWERLVSMYSDVEIAAWYAEREAERGDE